MARGGHLHTAIGAFDSHEGAAGAVTELLQRGVPRESIVFLSRSHKDAKIIGSVLGGSIGSSLGFVAATPMVVPGMGEVCAIGLGATALLGLVGAAAGAAAGKAAVHNPGTPQPTPDRECSQDAAFFCEVLKQ